VSTISFRVAVKLGSVIAVAALAAAIPVGRALAGPGTFNVRDFGATGNGSTLDDDAIDRAINAASSGTGGGVVVFPAGTYRSRSIHLKSNITLQLASGATIRAATSGFDAAEPNPFSRFQDFGHSHFHNALMWGENVENIAITGTGTIDGDGLTTDNAVPAGVGDKILSLKLCANITLRDVTFRRGGHFAVLTNGCHDVLLDRVKILSTMDRDGVNFVNTWNVEVRDSRIEGQDDALSFKSDFALGRTFTSEHIHVHSSTILSTENNAIQFGVESCGDFRDARFEDIAITGAGKAGIGIVSLDGGAITDIHFTRVTLNRVSSPVFMRLGGRGSCPGSPPPGRISGVSITDVTGSNLTTPAPVRGAPEYASTIVGSPGADITDVSLTNVKLTVPGGHPASDATVVPPENLVFYRPREFGTRPAYGFWMRHVARITFTNTDVQFVSADGRPAFATDNGERVEWLDSRAERSTGTFDARFTNTNGYGLQRTTTTTGQPLRIRSVNSTPLPGPSVFVLPAEPENGPVSEPMRVFDDPAASGGRYVAVAPGNNSKTAAPATGHATATFTVPADATCKIWTRVIAATTGDDSFWVRIDGGPWIAWNAIPLGTAWHWADVRNASGSPLTATLTAGEHTVVFAYREDGARLDRILLTNDLGANPPAIT
jgi:polygalacturonase